MKRQPRPSDLGLVVVATLGLMLCGCTEEPDARPSSGTPETSDAGSTTPPLLEGDSTLLSPGTYEFSFLKEHGGKVPGALVDLPAGWVDGDNWYVVSEDGDVFLGMWTTQQVRRDACVLPRHDDLAPGPGITDLADALVAQESTRATPPEPLTFAGYQAVHLELTGPHDISKCDPEPGLADVRGIYSDDQVDLLWIVDADGQRLVVDASYGPSANSAERAALTAMVESLRFVTATG